MQDVVWSRVRLDGSAVRHATIGHGPNVVFLHGWGLDAAAYLEPLRRLAAYGCTVWAPSLPGFGGSSPLPRHECSFPGYALWAARYLQMRPETGPLTVVGHSFGGGVAVQLAHDHPALVRSVTLCNAVGGPALIGPRESRPMAERRLWEWGRHFGADLLSPRSLMRVLPTVLGSAASNLAHHPLATWRVGDFVRRADLVAQLSAVAEQGTPVTVVWSDRDRIAPQGGFLALARATGSPGVTVPGTHNWMLGDPDLFAEVVFKSMAEAGVWEETLEHGEAGPASRPPRAGHASA